jgi:hypothetical protein
MSKQSHVWSEVVSSLKCALPTLLDSYATPTDAQAIAKCADSSLSADVLAALASSYKRNANLFKTNFAHALKIIEQLLLANRLDDASDFIDETIEVQFNTAVDVDTLLRMFIRVCPQMNSSCRNDLCRKVISPISNTLEDIKCNKKLAPVFFDFAVVVLDLRVDRAPTSALRVLSKREFYPWKDLASSFNRLVRPCAVYDTIKDEVCYDDLVALDDILELAVKQANLHVSITQATHDEALRAVLRWSESPSSAKKIAWPIHVYRMGRQMVFLIDERKITIDTSAQLIEALRKRVISGNEDDSEEDARDLIASYFNVSTYAISLSISNILFRPYHPVWSLSSSCRRPFLRKFIVN